MQHKHFNHGFNCDYSSLTQFIYSVSLMLNKEDEVAEPNIISTTDFPSSSKTCVSCGVDADIHSEQDGHFYGLLTVS